MTRDVSVLANDGNADDNSEEVTDAAVKKHDQPQREQDGFLFCFRCGAAMTDPEICPRCRWRMCATCEN